MPNGGWNGTKEQWERIEAPIKRLDAGLARFAKKHGLQITYNLKDWPGRSMEWGDSTRCLIQFYLDDADTLGINLWICASQDRSNGRYWKERFLLEGAAADAIAPKLSSLLNDAKRKLNEWSSQPEILEFATKLAKP